MTTHDDIVRSFADNAGASRSYRRYAGSNVFAAGDTIYSYGYHFPMATLMGDRAKGTAWWLVNGDRYSVSTSAHQSLVRGYVNRTGLPVIIVPFSALERAGIRKDTIKITDVTEDGVVTRTRRVPVTSLPAYIREDMDYYISRGDTVAATEDPGMVEYTTREHQLGESVFRAAYDAGRRSTARPRTAYFLSGFDDQDGNLYFLAQLPAKARPRTVAEAREALRPQAVRDADAAGVEVTRQGDIFAIPVTVPTSHLPGPSAHRAYILDTNHTATEVRTAGRLTYARGCLRHQPQWRAAEHRMRKMGDGKGWHLLVKNTVPMVARQSRSWSVNGNVD